MGDGYSKTEQTSIIIQQITYKTTNKDVKRIIILLAKDKYNPAMDCTNKIKY